MHNGQDDGTGDASHQRDDTGHARSGGDGTGDSFTLGQDSLSSLEERCALR